MRQVVLDTETTGLFPIHNHKIIEIGCLEIMDRKLTGNFFHSYLFPGCNISVATRKITGITDYFLSDKPKFGSICNDFLEFVVDSELIIHNAKFDISFINHELFLAGSPIRNIENYVDVTDVLKLARNKHPGQKNSLDALCKRYSINNFERNDGHGALIDSKILAEVYFALTSNQFSFSFTDKRVVFDEFKKINSVNKCEILSDKLKLEKINKNKIEYYMNYFNNIEKNIY